MARSLWNSRFTTPRFRGRPVGETKINSVHGKRVLHTLAERLGLPKLTFQVIRRTIATLGQHLGSVKDAQCLLRHMRAPTTTDRYMQVIVEGAATTLNSLNIQLTKKQPDGKARKTA
jgi:hypothetical protein